MATGFYTDFSHFYTFIGWFSGSYRLLCQCGFRIVVVILASLYLNRIFILGRSAGIKKITCAVFYEKSGFVRRPYVVARKRGREVQYKKIVVHYEIAKIASELLFYSVLNTYLSPRFRMFPNYFDFFLYFFEKM